MRNRSLSLAVYSALLWLAQPLLRCKLRRRGVAEPGYLVAVDERFGHYTTPRPTGDAPLIWIHAVSLGETRAAALLVAALRARLPTMRLLLTHGTATGRAEGQKLLRDGDVQVWQPWDSRGATQRFVDHFRPDLGVLMETEIWPNLMAACSASRVPVALANARLSAKSLRGAQRVGRLLRPAYRSLSAVYAQTEGDAGRFRALGVPHVTVLGNLKFDAAPDPAQQAHAARWRAALGMRPVVMLASSREGEEADFLQQIRSSALAEQARQAIENEATKALAPLWLMVPRHPQRFVEVASLAHAAGFAVAQRSTWALPPAADGLPPPSALAADVWIGDSLGEMALYYSLADVALLGGSFAPLGGQNLIEAAACGCPVVMGPHTFNFAQAAEWAEAAGAAQRVPDMAAAMTFALDLVADVPRHAAMQQAGHAFAAQHRGATRRTAAALAALLRAPSSLD